MLVCQTLAHRPWPSASNIALLTPLLPDSGAQPLVNDDETLALAVNGEIYNHRILRKSLKHKYNFKTHSDCEVIIPLVCAGRYLCLLLRAQAVDGG